MLPRTGVVAIDRIEIDPPRPEPDPKVLATLVDSIKKVGLLNPITVRRTEPFGIYLVAGFHRLSAFKALGREEISVRYLEDEEWKALGALDGRLAEVAENLHRKHLTADERADLIRAYAEVVAEQERITTVDLTGGADCATGQGTRQSNLGNQPGVATKTAHALRLSKATVNRALARTRSPDEAPARKAKRPAAPAAADVERRDPPAAAGVERRPEPAPAAVQALVTRGLAGLRAAWDAATETERATFLAEIGAGRAEVA